MHREQHAGQSCSRTAAATAEKGTEIPSEIRDREPPLIKGLQIIAFTHCEGGGVAIGAIEGVQEGQVFV